MSPNPATGPYLLVIPVQCAFGAPGREPAATRFSALPVTWSDYPGAKRERGSERTRCRVSYMWLTLLS